VRSVASLFHGAEVNIEQIRYQVALPETADELCQVAQRLGVPDSEILLGANATEAQVKDLSPNMQLCTPPPTGRPPACRDDHLVGVELRVATSEAGRNPSSRPNVFESLVPLGGSVKIKPGSVEPCT
jgi:hypothetical protein